MNAAGPDPNEVAGPSLGAPSGDAAPPTAHSPGADEGAGPYLRLPWPLVAGVLLAVLALALGVGLYANRNLRPGSVAAATPVAAISLVTATPVAAVSTAATPVPPALAPTAVPTTAAVLAPTPSAPPTAAPTPLVLVLGTATSPPQPPSPSAIPTVDPALAAELDAAYQHYWEVLADALFDLDTTHLPEVMADQQLATVKKLIDDLRVEGHAIRTEVDHQYAVIRASSNDALIIDKYTDTSIYVQPGTHDPIGTPVNDVIEDQFRLRQIEGTWRVVSIVRAP